MIIDCHCHIFTPQVIRNIVSKSELIRELRLDPNAAAKCKVDDLVESARRNYIGCCILYPTSPPENVISENDRYSALASSNAVLKTLATLHPDMKDIAGEAQRAFSLGTTGFKFCSFSQRFDILSEKTETMLLQIRDVAAARGRELTIVFDTFTRAGRHFGARAEHLTTPGRLNALVGRFPEIRFMAAHMGGLAADFKELRNELLPAANLFLDTSNAAHTLDPEQFVELLHVHGAEHVLFGTDWPFFDHDSEIPLIDSLLTRAGFNDRQKESVFRGNAERLF